MITESDSYNTVDLGKYFAILPINRAWSIDDYMEQNDAKRFPEGESYSSGKNDEFLTIEQLEELINKYVPAS